MEALFSSELASVHGGRVSVGGTGGKGESTSKGSSTTTGGSTNTGSSFGLSCTTGQTTSSSTQTTSCTTASSGETTCTTTNSTTTSSTTPGCTASVGSSDGGGSSSKVICTELCRNGIIDHDIWMADLRYSRENFNDQTMRGYHAWGVPYVKLMRKYPAFAKIAAAPTRWFAEDIAYRMGVRAKPSYAGWALRELAFRPLCWTIGIVAKKRDYQSLWSSSAVASKTLA
jgi:hypothetical protein